MDGQLFGQAAMGFVIGMTGINILISFLQLCLEERKKSSIIKDKNKEAGKVLFDGERKKYAVLGCERRYA